MVMAEPPVLAGTVKLISALAFPGVADNEVGAPAVVISETATADEAVPEPTAFTARSLT